MHKWYLANISKSSAGRLSDPRRNPVAMTRAWQASLSPPRESSHIGQSIPPVDGNGAPSASDPTRPYLGRPGAHSRLSDAPGSSAAVPCQTSARSFWGELPHLRSPWISGIASNATRRTAATHVWAKTGQTRDGEKRSHDIESSSSPQPARAPTQPSLSPGPLGPELLEEPPRAHEPGPGPTSPMTRSSCHCCPWTLTGST